MVKKYEIDCKYKGTAGCQGVVTRTFRVKVATCFPCKRRLMNEYKAIRAKLKKNG